MPLKTLSFTNLGPFDEVGFEFDPQVNVLVGPNNCGKSTALIAMGHIIIRGFGLPRKLLRGPDSTCRMTAVSEVSRSKRNFEYTLPVEIDSVEDKPVLARWHRLVDPLGYVSFVPALRSSTDFRSEGPIRPAKGKHDLVHMRPDGTLLYTGSGPEGAEAVVEQQATLVRDAEVVQDMVELDYRSYRQKKPGMRKIIDRIAMIASEVTEGFPITFVGIAEDKRGLYPEFDTPDGKVPLDVLSQGTQSLIQWLGRLLIGYAKHYDFPANLKDKPGILIIDEIDAHLHPSWQRRVIPALNKEFPSLQVFCSTHSPLMLAGLRAGQVHLLQRDAKGKVGVTRNESDIVGWTSDEIVTTFLGVENATDLQTETSLMRLRELRDRKRLRPKERRELESLRDTINERMLAGPAAQEVEVDQIISRLRRPTAQSKENTTAKRKPATRKPATRRKRTNNRST